VAAGLAAWRSFNPTTVRIAFALLTVFTSGAGVALYVAGWLFIPAKDEDTSIGARARTDAKGIALAIGLGTLLTIVLLIAGVFNDGWFAGWAWPQVFSLAGLTLIWRNADPDEQATLKRLVQPLEAAAGGGGGNSKRAVVIRVAVAAVLLVTGVTILARAHESLALLQPLGAFALVVAAIVLFLGPWWLRIGRDLVAERQARIRAEEQKDIASQLHDSVLQTLALIQRRADDPQKVVQLARMQERELRDWLFGGKAPGETAAETFADGVRLIQADVETRYGVPVEVVTVGDCELDENLSALLAAAREATINAAKWSGASVISVYAEAEASAASVVVRDRGKGFDPEQVPADRKGLAESIRGRMARRGGTATVTSAAGEGTKVSLSVPRTDKAGAPA